MLHVIKIDENVIPALLETDIYVPIKVSWEEVSYWNKEIVYWRTGDLKKSFLEIGIDSKTGIMRDITVLLANKIFFDVKKENLTIQETKYGTPIFDLSLWTSINHIDEEGLFEIHLLAESIDLILSRNTVYQRIISGRISFDLDENSNLCIISINNLTKEEHYHFNQSLRTKLASSKQS